METSILVLFFILVLCPHGRSGWPSGCRDDMVINDTCYVLHSITESYTRAQSQCELNGGTLAIIKNSETNNKISAFVQKEDCITSDSESSRVWIGLNDKDSEGDFRYSDKTKLGNNYQPWAYNRPRRGNWNDDDCVALIPYNQRWYDQSCSLNKKFVCQYKASTCNTLFINVKNAEFENCYRYSEIPFGFNVSIKCQEGYILVGSSIVSCIHDGEWTEMPQCLKGCLPPPSYPNAKMMNSKDHYFVDDVASYICDEGYFSSRYPKKTHFTIRCSSKGKWVPPRSGCSRAKKYQIKGMEVMPNDTVRLICDINKSSIFLNKSNGLYFWMKDSNYLSSDKFEYKVNLNGDLIIYGNSSENIEGFYMCFMSGENLVPGNTVYDVKHTKIIQCDDESSDKKTHYVYKEGASALLSCPHSSSYEGFHWFKDGEYFPLNDDHVLYPDGSLYIRQIEFSHQGTYTCMMTIKDTFCSKNITAEVVVLVSSESICGNPNNSLSHPWIVSLWWQDEVAPFCYGTLIHENWVVTTANCLSGVYRKRKLSIFVRFGSDPMKDVSSREKGDSNIVDIPIVMAKIHPFFSKKRYVNDIGLVKLKQPVQFSNTIQPICVNKLDLTVKTPCDQSPPLSGKAIGWGSIERDDVGEIALSEEHMTFVPYKICFPIETVYSDKVLCFENSTGTRETFASDSGSPLEVVWKDRVYLLGIYSWGDRSARLGKYDYFTKVSTYVSWFSTFLEEE